MILGKIVPNFKALKVNEARKTFIVIEVDGEEVSIAYPDWPVEPDWRF
jgi:hypothetical protein